MKTLVSAVLLATLAVGSQAQVAYSGGTPTTISNYDPGGFAGLLTAAGGLENASLGTTTGLLRAAFLGYEAFDVSSFSFSTTLGTLFNRGMLGGSIAGLVVAGPLNFAFTDVTMATTVGNGGSSGGATSYAVLGSFDGSGGFTASTLGGLYDVILGFNDGRSTDADYDDMVVGLRMDRPVNAVPEPETYALLLAGLAAIGVLGRRRKEMPTA